MGGSKAKRFGSHLGLVVATCLVTVTLMGGGPVGAFSVPNNSVTSAKIINGTIQGIDIKPGAIGPGQLGLSARPRWAKVAGTGLVRGRGATSANRLDVGRYLVVFEDSVRNCAFTVTSQVVAGLWLLDWADEFHVAPPSQQFPSVVEVDAFNSSGGSPADLGEGQAFALVAHC